VPIERRLAAHGLADGLDQPLDARPELPRPLGRLEAVRATDEQRIAEHVSKARERMADCRRTETELVRDGARSAAREEFAKDQQQAAIQLPDLQLVEFSHRLNSVFRMTFAV